MHLHSLDFSGCTFADDRQFKSFIKSCFVRQPPRDTVLNKLIHLFALVTNPLSSTPHYQNLKHLVLSHSGGMGEEKIFLLAQNLSKLEVRPILKFLDLEFVLSSPLLLEGFGSE